MRRLTLLMSSSLTVLSGAAIAPALPAMAKAFAAEDHADLWVRLVMAMPSLSTIVAAPLAGWLVDRSGRRWVLVVSVLLYGVAGTAGAFAGSLTFLLVSRAFLGVAASGILTAGTTLIADYYVGEKRRTVMGQHGAFAAFGGVIFLLGGGFLAELTWRASFGLYAVGLLLLPLILLFLHEPERVVQHGHGSEAAFAAVPRSFVAGIYTLAFLGQMVFYLIPVELPFLLVEMGETSSVRSGLALAAMALAATVSGAGYSRVRARFPFVTVCGIVFAVLAGGYVLIAGALSYGVIILGLVVAGFGFGLFLPNLNTWVNDAAPAAVRGRIMGGMTTSIYLGQFFSPIVVRPIAAGYGLRGVFAASAVACLILAVGLFLRRRG